MLQLTWFRGPYAPAILLSRVHGFSSMEVIWQVSLVLTVIHLVVAIGLIVAVMLQSGKSAGLSGAIGGGTESFFGRKKGREEKLERATIIFSVLFMITALLSVVF